MSDKTPTKPPKPTSSTRPQQPTLVTSAAISAASLSAPSQHLPTSQQQPSSSLPFGTIRRTPPSVSIVTPPNQGSPSPTATHAPASNTHAAGHLTREEAMRVLRHLMRPLLTFYLYRERRKFNRLANRSVNSNSNGAAPQKPSKPKRYKLGEIVECIKTCRRSFLSRWPHEVLGELLRQAHIRFCHDGEVIVYEREPWWCSGVVIALAGQVKVLPSQRRTIMASTTPRDGSTNPTPSPIITTPPQHQMLIGKEGPSGSVISPKVLSTPLVITDDVVLSQGEGRHTVVAVGFVDCVLINSKWLIEFMFGSRMNPKLPRFLSSVDHAETLKEVTPLRLGIVAKQYPMTVPLILRSWLMQCWYLSFAELLEQHAAAHSSRTPQSNNPLSSRPSNIHTAASSPNHSTMGQAAPAIANSALARLAAKVAALGNQASMAGSANLGAGSPLMTDVNATSPHAPWLAKTRAFLGLVAQGTAASNGIHSDTATPIPSNHTSMVISPPSAPSQASEASAMSVFTSGLFAYSNAAELLLTKLVPLMEPRSYFPGDTIVAAGQPLTAIYFIRRGRAKAQAPSFSIASISELGRRTPSSSPLRGPSSLGASSYTAGLGSSQNANQGQGMGMEEYYLEAGSVYGEWGCLFERASMATVTAASMCDIWQLRQHTLQEWFNTVPDPATVAQLLESASRIHSPRTGMASSTKSSASSASHYVVTQVPPLTSLTGANVSLTSSTSTFAPIDRVSAPTPPPAPGGFHIGLVSSLDVPEVRLFASEGQQSVWLHSVRKIVIGTATLKRELWWLKRLDDSLIARGDALSDSSNNSVNLSSQAGGVSKKKAKDALQGSLQSILFQSLRRLPALEQVSDPTLRGLIASSTVMNTGPSSNDHSQSGKGLASSALPHPAVFLPSTLLTALASEDSPNGGTSPTAPSTPMYVKASSGNHSSATPVGSSNLPTDAIIVVLSGTVRSQTALPADGAPEVSACGAVLGENALYPHRWYYTWQAVTLVEAWVFPIAGLVEQVVKHQGGKGKSTSIIQHAETVSSNALRDIERRNGLKDGELSLRGAGSYVNMAMDILAQQNKNSSMLEGSTNKTSSINLSGSSRGTTPSAPNSAPGGGGLSSSATSATSSALSRRQSSVSFANSSVFLLNQRPASSFVSKFGTTDKLLHGHGEGSRLKQLLQVPTPTLHSSGSASDPFALSMAQVEEMACQIATRESMPVHPLDENYCQRDGGEPDSFCGIGDPSPSLPTRKPRGPEVANAFFSPMLADRKSKEHGPQVSKWLKDCMAAESEDALLAMNNQAVSLMHADGSVNGKSMLGMSLLRVPVKAPLPPRPERVTPNTAGPTAGASRAVGIGGAIVGTDPVTLVPRSPADQRTSVTYQRQQQLAAAAQMSKDTPLGTARSTVVVLPPNGPPSHQPSPRGLDNSTNGSYAADGNNSMLGNTSILLSRSLVQSSVGPPPSGSPRSQSPQQPPPRPATTSSLPSAAAIASMVLLPPVELLEDEVSMMGPQAATGSSASTTKAFSEGEESDFNNTARSDADLKLLLRKDTTTPSTMVAALSPSGKPPPSPRSPPSRGSPVPGSKHNSPGRTDVVIEKEIIEARRLTSVVTRDLKSAAPPTSGRSSAASRQFIDRRLHSAYRGEQTPIAEGLEEEHASAIAVEGAIFRERRPTQADALWVLDDERFDIAAAGARANRMSLANPIMGQRGRLTRHGDLGIGARVQGPMSIEAAGLDENPDYEYDDEPADATDIADDYLNEAEGGNSTLVLLAHVTKAIVRHGAVTVSDRNVVPMHAAMTPFSFAGDSSYNNLFGGSQENIAVPDRSPTFSVLGDTYSAPFMAGSDPTSRQRSPTDEGLPQLKEHVNETHGAQMPPPPTSASAATTTESLLALHPADQFVCRVLDARGKVVLRTPVADICSVSGLDDMDKSGSGLRDASGKVPEVGITWSRCSAASFIVNVNLVLAELQALEEERRGSPTDPNPMCFTVELRRCCRFNEESLLRLQAEDASSRPLHKHDSFSTKKLSPLDADQSPIPTALGDTATSVVLIDELNTTNPMSLDNTKGGRFFRKRGLSVSKAGEHSVASTASGVVDEPTHDYFKSVLVATAALRREDLEKASTGMRPLTLSLPYVTTTEASPDGSPLGSLAGVPPSQSPLPNDPSGLGSNSSSLRVPHTSFSTTSARGPKHVERLHHSQPNGTNPSPSSTVPAPPVAAGVLYLSLLVSRTTEKDVRSGSAAIRQHVMAKQQRAASAGRHGASSPSEFNVSGANKEVSMDDSEELESYAAAGIKGGEEGDANGASWGSGGASKFGGYRFPTSASGARGQSVSITIGGAGRIGSNTLRPESNVGGDGSNPFRMRTRQQRKSMLEGRRAVRANSLAIGVAEGSRMSVVDIAHQIASMQAATSSTGTTSTGEEQKLPPTEAVPEDRRPSLLEDDGLADSHLFPEGLVVQIHKCENLPSASSPASPVMLSSSLTNNFNTSRSSPTALPPLARVRLLCEEESDLIQAGTGDASSRPQSQAGFGPGLPSLGDSTSTTKAVARSVLVRTREVLCVPEASNGARSYDPTWEFGEASWVHDLSGAFSDPVQPTVNASVLPPRVSVAYGNEGFSTLAAMASMGGGGVAGQQPASRARALIFVVEDAVTGLRLGTAKIRISEMQMEGEATSRRIPLDLSTGTTAAASPSSTVASLNATGNSFAHNATFVMGGRSGEFEAPSILISFAVLKATRVVPIDRTLLRAMTPKYTEPQQPSSAFLLVGVKQCSDLLDVDSEGTPGDPFVKLWVESHYRRRRSIDANTSKVRREDLVLQTKMKKETSCPSWSGNKLSDRVGVVALKLLDPMSSSAKAMQGCEAPPHLRLEVWDSTDTQWIDLIGLVKAPLNAMMGALLPHNDGDGAIGPAEVILHEGLAVARPTSNDNDEDAPAAVLSVLTSTLLQVVQSSEQAKPARGTVALEATLVIGGVAHHPQAATPDDAKMSAVPVLPQMNPPLSPKPSKERPPLPLSPTRGSLPSVKKSSIADSGTSDAVVPPEQLASTIKPIFAFPPIPQGGIATAASFAFTAAIQAQATSEVGETSMSGTMPLGTSLGLGLGLGSSTNPMSPNKRRSTPVAPIPSIPSLPAPSPLPSPTAPPPTTKVSEPLPTPPVTVLGPKLATSSSAVRPGAFGANSLLAKVMGIQPQTSHASPSLHSPVAPSRHPAATSPLKLSGEPVVSKAMVMSSTAKVPTPPATPSPALTPRAHLKSPTEEGLMAPKHIRTTTDAFEDEQPRSMVVASPAPAPEPRDGNEPSFATIGPEQEPASAAGALVDPPQSIRSLMRLPGMNINVLTSALHGRK